MKLKLYSHMNDMLQGMDITRQQLKKITESGLIDHAEIYFFPNFNEENYQWMKDQLKDYANVHFVNVGALAQEWELPTLVTLKEHCDNSDEECYVGYIHHKGVTHSYKPIYPMIVEWREMLEYFTIEKWRDATALLNEYEIVGVNWSTTPWPHFSGNFWWARSSYIKRLPKLRRTTGAEFGKTQFGDYTKGWQYQYDCEVWSSMGNPKCYNLHTSGVDHYKQSYPAYNYRKN